MDDAPQITVNGSTVIWQRGGQRTRHSLGSHDEALEVAARLEGEWEAEQQSRQALYENYLARGVDVVVRAEDVERVTQPDPAPDPAPDPGEDPELEIDASVEWDDETSRVTVSITSNTPLTLWRSIGGRSSSFEVAADQPLTRTFKAEYGDAMFIRVGDEEGPEILATTFDDDLLSDPGYES